MIRTFHALRTVQPGFAQPEKLQLIRVSIPPSQVQDPARVIRMQNDILDKIAAEDPPRIGFRVELPPRDGNYLWGQWHGTRPLPSLTVVR